MASLIPALYATFLIVLQDDALFNFQISAFFKKSSYQAAEFAAIFLRVELAPAVAPAILLSHSRPCDSRLSSRMKFSSTATIIMPKSEIDDIFAGKGKAKAKEPIPSPSQSLPASKSSKKKNKRKSKPEVNEQPQPSSSKKRPLPETVVDTSTTLGKRPKI